MYKLIISDLDSTLLTDDYQLPANNLAAIKRARARGIQFIPATGRGITSIDATLQALGVANQKGEYVISCSGGVITENYQNRLLYHQGISFKLAEELYQRGLKHNVSIHISTLDRTYVRDLLQTEMAFLKNRSDVTEIYADNLSFLKDSPIIRIVFMNHDQQYLRKIVAAFADITSQLEIIYSAKRYAEFLHAGVNKGSGLLRVAELLKVKPAEIIAIGDNPSDAAMLQLAGLSIAVNNAEEGLKAISDYVTAATNNEGAIAEVIDKFITGQ